MGLESLGFYGIKDCQTGKFNPDVSYEVLRDKETGFWFSFDDDEKICQVSHGYATLFLIVDGIETGEEIISASVTSAKSVIDVKEEELVDLGEEKIEIVEPEEFDDSPAGIAKFLGHPTVSSILDELCVREREKEFEAVELRLKERFEDSGAVAIMFHFEGERMVKVGNILRAAMCFIGACQYSHAAGKEKSSAHAMLQYAKMMIILLERDEVPAHEDPESWEDAYIRPSMQTLSGGIYGDAARTGEEMIEKLRNILHARGHREYEPPVILKKPLSSKERFRIKQQEKAKKSSWA